MVLRLGACKEFATYTGVVLDLTGWEKPGGSYWVFATGLIGLSLRKGGLPWSDD